MKAAHRITMAFVLFVMATPCRGTDVVKSDVAGQGFVADLYCNRDLTNKVGILVLGGSEGGRPRGYLTRLFATNGYPTLALAYFQEKGLPESLQSIPLEYFNRVIDWMETNTSFHLDRIVVFGASRGAEAALLLGSMNPKIKGVIALSPSSVVWFGLPKDLPIVPCSSWTLGGEPVPYMPYYAASNYAPPDLHAIYTNVEAALTKAAAVTKATIKAEKINGSVLLASGYADEIIPATTMADAICSRLNEKGFKYRYENLKYPHAGHTLDEHWMLGGTFEGNREARIDLERHLLEFLKGIESDVH